MSRLVPADVTAYSELNPRGRLLREVVNPDTVVVTADLQRAFVEHISEHPVIAYHARTGDLRAHKMSDFLSRRQFHDLGLYTEFFQHVDVEFEMSVVLAASPRLVIGLTLNRSLADFSERERLMLDLLQPHLLQARRNADAVTAIERRLRLADRAIEEIEHGVVVLSRAGRIVRVSPSGGRWLAEYFAGDRPTARRLPDVLRRWVRRAHDAAGRDDDVLSPREPLVVERDGRRLVLRHLCGREECLLLLREQWTVLDPASFEPLGLTRREAEVLAWLVQGRTNSEIALILGSRPKTIGKHLERIYQKLGVETRTAAVTTAMQAARTGL